MPSSLYRPVWLDTLFLTRSVILMCRSAHAVVLSPSRYTITTWAAALAFSLSAIPPARAAETPVTADSPSAQTSPVSSPIPQQLRDAATDQNPETRQQAMRELAEYGQPAVELLFAGLRDDEVIVRWAAIWAIERIQNADVVPVLLEALPSGDARMDARIYFLLARRGDRRAFDAMITGLNHGNALVRRAAAAGLQRAAESGDEPLLAEAVKTAETPVIMELAIALAHVQTAEAAEILGRLMTHEDASVQQYAAENLSEMAVPEATAILLQYVDSPSAEVRAWVFDGLAIHGDQSAADALLAGAASTDPYVRQMSVFGLGRLGDPRGVPVIRAALKDPQPPVRWAAAEALGEAPAPDAVADLRKALSDSDETVRRAAALALIRHEDTTGMTVLLEALRHPDSRVRTEAARSLAVYSGETYGPDFEAWQAWWQREQAAPPAESAPEAS